jgi:ribosomal protein L31E
MTSFNTESKIVESKVARHIAIEKAKIDIRLKQANYSEGINQTY